MDARLLDYYNRELRFMREMGAEFAEEFPKIAGRLGIDGFDCTDPYVERLLEGFAFMAARIQLKVDAEFPDFTQHLLNVVYPNYAAPTPSMVIAQFAPDPAEGDLTSGFEIERGAMLKGRMGKDQKTRCEFSTAHALTLWPIEVAEASYFATRGAVASLGVTADRSIKAGLRLRLRTVGEVTFSDLPMDDLVVHIRGSEDLPGQIYEQLVGQCAGLVLQSPDSVGDALQTLPAGAITPVGLDDSEALLPVTSRDFSGYRLLLEYFAFAKRFMFVRIGGLKDAVARCHGSEFEIIALLDRSNPSLDRMIAAEQFALHCTPAVNLFSRRADRIQIDESAPEYHVVPDRTRPMDYEVHSVESVAGYGKSGEKERDFVPFYSFKDRGYRSGGNAYFSQHRRPRRLSDRQKRYGNRTSYLGSEVYLNLVDEMAAPFRSDLRQLAVTTLCTNRDLPMLMPVGGGDSDFELAAGAPVSNIQCLEGPTRPVSVAIDGSAPWRLISHLSLNYLSLLDDSDMESGAPLREILGLYAHLVDPASRTQIEGVLSCRGAGVVQRMPVPGPISFGRGLEITVNVDESAFEGNGPFLLGTVLEQFFARYASINSFTRTVMTSTERGLIHAWPARTGARHVL